MLLTKPCKILIFPKRKTSQKPANTALTVSATNYNYASYQASIIFNACRVAAKIIIFSKYIPKQKCHTLLSKI